MLKQINNQYQLCCFRCWYSNDYNPSAKVLQRTRSLRLWFWPHKRFVWLFGSRLTAFLTMVFKLARRAERRWRRLHGKELLGQIIEGVKSAGWRGPFVDGIKKAGP